MCDKNPFPKPVTFSQLIEKYGTANRDGQWVHCYCSPTVCHVYRQTDINRFWFIRAEYFYGDEWK